MTKIIAEIGIACAIIRTVIIHTVVVVVQIISRTHCTIRIRVAFLTLRAAFQTFSISTQVKTFDA